MGYDVNAVRAVLGACEGPNGSGGPGERAERTLLPGGLAVRTGELLGSLEFRMTPGGAVRVAMFGGDGRWSRCAAAGDLEALGDLVCRWVADMVAVEPPLRGEAASPAVPGDPGLREGSAVAEDREAPGGSADRADCEVRG